MSGIGSYGGLQPVSISGALKPVKNPQNITHITSASPNTETSVTLTTIKRYRMVNRGNVVVNYAYTLGQSGTNYSTIPPGGYNEEDNIDDQTITVYVQAPSASQRLEIITWS